MLTFPCPVAIWWLLQTASHKLRRKKTWPPPLCTQCFLFPHCHYLLLCSRHSLHQQQKTLTASHSAEAASCCHLNMFLLSKALVQVQLLHVTWWMVFESWGQSPLVLSQEGASCCGSCPFPSPCTCWPFHLKQPKALTRIPHPMLDFPAVSQKKLLFFINHPA